ncbi:M12 family metallopeptidase [Pseudomonas sp. ICMP 460]|uniref:M12 family metallopeptidase n=1 Tax=Pseudomonas sp. ICMP 460 TaxID=1718917 RepID=UPI000C06F72D|nr:M12 family metallopeptidase [Pseudomonas sp. ICMP 460]PHN23734.1 hypothetical protein AO240_04850 [Pseudomonas sp. ICMP 460]
MINNLPPIPFYPRQCEPSIAPDRLATHTQSLSRSRRNIGEPDKYWPQHSTLKIALYDYEIDDEYVQAVIKAASHWLPHINLKFEFVTGDEGDVRISQNLAGDVGGSSKLGTDAKEKPWYPSMYLPRNHADPRFEYVVMHEFGHMLGAHHAHQHPEAHIPWDIKKIAESYKLTGYMNEQDMKKNLLPLPRTSTYDFLPYDPDSVMHHEVEPSMTDGNWGQSESWEISDGDIAWAHKAYPTPEQP